jgi:hypothetical protein
MDDRKIPERKECPNCDVAGMVEQTITGVPGLVSDSMSTMRRAGSEWNDVLKGIKKASGRGNTIKT